MTFEDFFEKYRSDEGLGERQYTDVPLDMVQDLRDRGLNARTVFQLWLEDADDYGKPEVVSGEEIDRLVKGGATQIFRGMPDTKRHTGEEKLNQVLYESKYFSGEGVYGDGLYFAVNIDVAGTYASSSPGASGSVMRAVLKPGIKSISYDDAHAAFRKEHPDLFATNGDISAWARSKGYDAITVDHPANGRYYNIINRGAIVMSGKLGKAKGGKNGGTISF